MLANKRDIVLIDSKFRDFGASRFKRGFFFNGLKIVSWNVDLKDTRHQTPD